MQTPMLSNGFCAGIARETISPPHRIDLIGYGDRAAGNCGIHDDLTATALLLEQGGRKVALLACDLLCLNEFVVDRVRVALGPAIEPLILCSHTHSGPIVYADKDAARVRRVYVDDLVQRLVRAVLRAEATLAPAALSWATGQATIAVNRREQQPDGSYIIGVNPEGVADRSLNVLRVHTIAGAPLATLVNFACHGTVLGPQNRYVSADWIGALRASGEAELGGMVLFAQGATANLNPIRNTLGMDAAPWDAVQALGRQVAGQVLAACAAASVPLAPGPLGLLRREVWLPLNARADTLQPPKTYRRELLRRNGYPTVLEPLADTLLDHFYPWRARLEAREGRWGVPLRVNALRLGDVALVTFGAETFTEIGLAVKAISPAPYTLFASVTDGCVGYLPTDLALAEGGYEIEDSPLFYRYPAGWAAGAAKRATQAVAEMLQNLWG